ncbi:UNVERIFIED_CONTAM: hypothetical protein GTU68_045836 [Idotea baltica]|nr:hypothetical protein [Idotea baltica]
MLHSGHSPSIIFWGPPGVGKTTLALIIAKSLGLPFIQLSAISSGVKDVRAAIVTAKKAGKAILFIDEIHRFNKAQQDSLLGAIEKGTIQLIGATTENPSFEVINALLSRCQDIISAFIKSMRGSDPNGAVYWLARMIEGGEDPKFIARRMLILASEDIGNANPMALVIANNCFDAVSKIGFPESRIILSQAAIYLAASPKSNASYAAISKAQALVKQTGNLSVPLHLRNAPTKLMKELDYGKNYKYSHENEKELHEQEFLPDKISNQKIYEPSDNKKENAIRQHLKSIWKDKYNY